jgi:hypothetical protein
VRSVGDFLFVEIDEDVPIIGTSWRRGSAASLLAHRTNMSQIGVRSGLMSNVQS